MANAHRICEASGIRLMTKRHRHPSSDALPRRCTWSRATIKRVFDRGTQTDNPEHVHDVLGLTCSADDTQLFGDVIDGVSRWAIKWNVRTSEIGFILPAFRGLDLKGIRQSVQQHRIDVRDVQIAFIIAGAMRPAMEAIR